MPTVMGPSVRRLFVLGRLVLERAERALLSQLVLHPLSRGLEMAADCLVVRLGIHREHIVQQVGDLREGDQRRPLGLDVQQFRTGVCPTSHDAAGRKVLGPCAWHGHRCQRGLATGTAPNKVFSSVRSTALGRMARTAARARAPLLQILGGLLRHHEVLHTYQHGFTLAQRQPQRVHGQLVPLHRQHLAAGFVPVLTDADDFHPECHTNLREPGRLIRRALTSRRLNRSGANGPDCSSRRSRLWHPSSSALRKSCQVLAG